MKLLSDIGFECVALCGSRLEAWDNERIEAVLQRRGDQFAARDAQIAPFHARMIFASHGKVPVTLMDTTPGGPHALTPCTAAAFSCAGQYIGYHSDTARPRLGDQLVQCRLQL